MQVKTRLFLSLLLAGFIGVLSFLFLDLTALVNALPVTAGKPLPMSPWAIKLLGLIQPTAIVAVAVAVGVSLAPKVNLSAPAFEAWARKDSVVAALRPQILPGVLGGVIGAIAIVLSWAIAQRVLPPDFVHRAEQVNGVLPMPARLLYGGITEEILLRWGLLTLIVWVAWKLFQRGGGRPKAIYSAGAILISSIVFGLGHLPLTVALGSPITWSIFLYVVIANSIFGFIAGYLFWRKGLEAAMLAHMLVHVGIFSAMALAR